MTERGTDAVGPSIRSPEDRSRGWGDGAPGSRPAPPPWLPPAEGRNDPFRADLVLSPQLPALLRVFNQAGLLAPADVHAATRLAGLAGESDDHVILAAALAVRGPRVGHVSVDLDTVRTSAVVGEDEVDLESLPWPEPSEWVRRVGASPLVSVVAGLSAISAARPLRLVGSNLYLDRYWRDEAALAADLLGRAVSDLEDATREGACQEYDCASESGAGDLERLFPGDTASDQRNAAASALTRRLSVLCGGPGTGKTTTVARMLALLCEWALQAGRRPPFVALTAPTGKAAARMEEAVRDESAQLPVSDATRRALGQLRGTTIHRLLAARPDRLGQFRHHRSHRLPHEVVVVDEASMVSLSLMARLVEAVRPDARLILVGDPEQLVSVEAGAVLADIVGAAPAYIHAGGSGSGASGSGPRGSAGGRGPAVAPSTHRAQGPSSPGIGSKSLPLWPDPEVAPKGPMAGAISVLRTNHRFAGSLARLSEAVRVGDVVTALNLLDAGDEAIAWEAADPTDLMPPVPGPAPTHGRLAGLVADTMAWAGQVRDAARTGDAEGAIVALRTHRVLCAHRRGPAGVEAWNRAIEAWLHAGDPVAGDGPWYAGRPVLVTANDYSSRLFNGDTGVSVALPEGIEARSTLRVVFDDGPRSRSFSPSRLDAVETVYAMTVHKSQGSEFDHVALLLPEAGSRLLTRQLLYTALTRARRSIRVVGTEAALRTAIERPIARASGLGWRLWEAGSTD